MGFKSRIIAAILLLITVLAMNASLQAYEHEWHEAKNINGNFKAVSSQPNVEIFSAPKIIMIKVNHEVEVNLFTILGKLISSETLSPGIYQYEIESHGVYIIKTEATSCKLAI